MKHASYEGGESHVRLNGIHNQNNTTLDHPPLIERKLIYVLWNKCVFRNPDRCEHGLVPETGSTFVGCESVDED